jgi:hypothetical protein
MGFVGRLGVGAVLWGLFALACESIEQPVSGAVTLTGEWKTVTPPEPLRVAGKLEQKICLDVGLTKDVDFDAGVIVLENGERHTLSGEAIDDKEKAHSLKVAEQGRAICLYNAESTPRGPDFLADRIVRVRLRSEPPLQVAEIRWHSYDPH